MQGLNQLLKSKAQKVRLVQVHRYCQDILQFRQHYQDIPDILQSQIVPQSHQILQDILYQRNRMNQVMNQVLKPSLGQHSLRQYTHLHHQDLVHPNTQ